MVVKGGLRYAFVSMMHLNKKQLRWMSQILCIGVVACRGQVGNIEDDVKRANLAHGQVLKGRVSAAGSKNRFTVFRYDLVGRALSMQHVLEGTAYAYNYQFGYIGGARVGSELGMVQTQMAFPDEERVLQAFDAAGGLQKVTAVGSSYEDAIAGATKLNRFGQVEWTEAGNRTRTLRTYNAARQPLHVLTQNTATGEILQAFSYRYDKVGRVTQVRDFCSQTPHGTVCCDPRDASCTEGPLSASYEYDEAGWLKKMTSPQGNQPFQADAVGNLTQKNGAWQKYGENGLPHALTSVVNAQGQLVARYDYNPVGSIESMEEDGVVSRFVWNANHMPVRTEKNGQTTQRFYVGESLYKRLDTTDGKTSTTLFLPGLRIEDGQFRKFYGALAERESQPSNPRGTLRFYHVDHLGSSTAVSDEGGKLLSRTAYFPFGERRFSEGAFHATKQFTSKEQEQISGLYDFSARLYNPRTGRFMSADSVMDGINPYSYVHNNPINFVDPSGHITSDPPEEPICQNEECKFVIKTVEQAKGWLGKALGAVAEFFKGGGDGLAMAATDRYSEDNALRFAFYSNSARGQAYLAHVEKANQQAHANLQNGSSLRKWGGQVLPVLSSLLGPTVTMASAIHSDRVNTRRLEAEAAMAQDSAKVSRVLYANEYGPSIAYESHLQHPNSNLEEVVEISRRLSMIEVNHVIVEGAMVTNGPAGRTTQAPHYAVYVEGGPILTSGMSRQGYFSPYYGNPQGTLTGSFYGSQYFGHKQMAPDGNLSLERLLHPANWMKLEGTPKR